MKKMILLFALFFGAFACCEDVERYWEISDFTASVLNTQQNAMGEAEINTDTLLIMLDFDVEFIASAPSIVSPFVASAYATSCPSAGEQGMSDPIVDMTVTSNEMFNDIESGMPLGDILQTPEGVTISDVIQGSRDWPPGYCQQWLMQITQKPTNTSLHTFTIKIEFASGEQQTYELPPVRWL